MQNAEPMTSPSPPLQHSSSATAAIAIRVQGLYKHYGEVPAVRGLDFEVKHGEVFGLIGPDGAGKTTTFQILAGVMEASAGQVQVLGQPPRLARLNTGYLTQQFSLYLDLSVDENIRYSAGLRDVPLTLRDQRRDRYLALMDLTPFRHRLAGQLSGGMKQKLALCCALIAEPQVLLLDEPTTGVDPVSRREFWDVLATLSQAGVTIVVATPYMDEAERCHRVALIYDGQIPQMGTPAELRASLGLHRLEIHTQPLAQAEQVLLQAAGEGQLLDVQTFGDRLDVLVQQVDAGADQVGRILRQHHLPANQIQEAEPTLENVFVTRLRQQGSDPQFMPLPRMRDPALRPAAGAIAIAAHNLSKTFGSFQAVQGVNLTIRYGEVFGLLGANGAGKTTTIKMLCGLLGRTSGDVTLANQRDNLRSPALRQRIGYMSQKFTLYDDLTIAQNLEFYCGIYGISRRLRRAKIDWVLAISGLQGRDHLITGQLPGGWKQRVAFGASVMHEPDILFLDEPTSGVDPLARRQFWRLIEDLTRQGTAVLVTTHYLEEAEHCHRMGFMVAGAVVAEGSPQEIKAAQPGQLLEVVLPSPQAAAQLLKQTLASWRVSLFGDRLHVVLDDPARDLPQVRLLLQEAGFAVGSVHPKPFSLEDAFIGIVQRTQAAPSPDETAMKQP